MLDGILTPPAVHAELALREVTPAQMEVFLVFRVQRVFIVRVSLHIGIFKAVMASEN